MKLFNKKESIVDEKYLGPEIQEKTGAKKAIIGLTLAGLILGGSALGLSYECKANNPTNSVCPFTIIETKLFGEETGLKHQYKDLINYDKQSVEDEEYHDPRIMYVAPDGYILEDNVAVSYVKPTEVNRVKEDGTVVTHLEVPTGYVLTHDDEGNLVGMKKVTPTLVEEGAGVSFKTSMSNGYDVYGYWSYNDGEFNIDMSAKKLTHKLGR